MFIEIHVDLPCKQHLSLAQGCRHKMSYVPANNSKWSSFGVNWSFCSNNVLLPVYPFTSCCSKPLSHTAKQSQPTFATKTFPLPSQCPLLFKYRATDRQQLQSTVLRCAWSTLGEGLGVARENKLKSNRKSRDKQPPSKTGETITGQGLTLRLQCQVWEPQIKELQRKALQKSSPVVSVMMRRTRRQETSWMMPLLEYNPSLAPREQLASRKGQKAAGWLILGRAVGLFQCGSQMFVKNTRILLSSEGFSLCYIPTFSFSTYARVHSLSYM